MRSSATGASPPPRDLKNILDAAARLASTRSLPQFATAASESTADLLDADRAYCLFYDSDESLTWREGEGDGSLLPAGLATWAAREGRSVETPQTGSDPRWRPASDDPPGRGTERFVACAVADTSGQVHAVLVAVRSGGRPRFGAEDILRLEALAEHLGPIIGQLALYLEVEVALEEQQSDSPFRGQALQHHTRGTRHGNVLYAAPVWIQRSYWVVVFLVGAVLAYMVLGTVHQYSTGRAVVRLHDRTEVSARTADTLASVEVVAGQQVEEGQLLARFEDTDALANVGRLRAEVDRQMRQYLLSDAPTATGTQLVALQQELATAEVHLESREVRAPHDGVVGEIRIRAGQHIQTGQVVLTLIKAEATPHVLVVLPGGDRPQVGPGARLRLQLDNYQYAYQDLEIDWVADEVIGPTEAHRVLGPSISDSLELAGPVVMVRARLPATTFAADGRHYPYHDGMLGVAEARIRSESVLVTLFPFLKGL